MVFQKGLDPNRYNGGSVPGHAPTSDGSQLPKGGNPALLRQHQFQPGNKPQNNGRPATSKQRHCMEAVQNLESLDDAVKIEKITQRFPMRMVLRLVQLQRASEDRGDPFFLQAQRLIREILLVPNRKGDTGEDEDDSKPKGATVIRAYFGDIRPPPLESEPSASPEPGSGPGVPS